MHRFFVEPALLAVAPDSIMLPDNIAHQVRDVLRLAIGESLVLLDNSGDEVVAKVAKSNRAGVEVQYVERRPGKGESPVRIILCQGLLKSARFEWVLEKGTELGVAVFVPTLCQRSMAGLEKAGPAKIARWQHIIQEAAEQCNRSYLPELRPICPLLYALYDIPKGAFALMLWEEEHASSLREALTEYGRGDPRGRPGSAGDRSGSAGGRPGSAGDRPASTSDRPGSAGGRPASTSDRSGSAGDRIGNIYDNSDLLPSSTSGRPMTVVLFIGPEGGLTEEEVALARRHGVRSVTLGQRTLRAETAALAAVANVMYALEE